MQGNTLSVKVT